jgi:hypothetical protein
MAMVTSVFKIGLLACAFFVAWQGNTAEAQSSELAAPSGLTQLGPVLSWTDNSAGEDGFRIEVRLSSSTGLLPEKNFSYEVGANVTSFTLPPEANTSCEYSVIGTAVSAFRGGETSEAARRGIVGECELPIVLGGTGMGAGSPELRGDLASRVTAISVLVFMFGVGLILGARSGSRWHRAGRESWRS